MFFESIAFLFILFFAFYLPGRFIQERLKIQFTAFIITIFLSLVLGIALFLLCCYILAWTGFAIFYNMLIVIIAVVYLKSAMTELFYKVRFTYFNYIQLFLLFGGVLAMGSIEAYSGIILKNGSMAFYGAARDGFYHLSIIAGMTHNFPPQLFSNSGLPLRGYHFFYDFLAAEIIAFYHLNIFDVVFRFLPFFISTLYGLSFISLAKFLRMNRIASLTLLYLSFFATNLNFLLPIILHRPSIAYGIGINPLLLNIFDPSVILSTAIFIGFFVLMFSYKQKSIVLPALLLGVLPEVKIYVAVLAYFSLILVMLVAFFQKKETYYIKLFILSAIISAFVFLPFNWGTAGLIFAPFVLYDSFIQNFVISNNEPWYLQYLIYRAHNNYLRIILFSSLTLSLYFLPTLGVRIVSILSLKRMFNRKFYTLQHVFLLFFVIVAFLFASFFITNIDVFNNVQFLWFAYIILLIPTAYTLGQLVDYAKQFKLGAGIILFCILLLLSYVSLKDTLMNSYTSPVIIDSSLVRLTDYIQNNTGRDEAIFVLNRITSKNSDDNIYNEPLVSGLSLHPIYYEPTLTAFTNALGVQESRQKNIQNVEELLMSCKNIQNIQTNLQRIFKEAQVRYIMTFPETQNASHCLDMLSIVTKERAYSGYMLYKIL